mgnify:CR=1
MVSKQQYNFIINISYTSPPFIYYIHSVRLSGYFLKREIVDITLFVVYIIIYGRKVIFYLFLFTFNKSFSII